MSSLWPCAPRLSETQVDSGPRPFCARQSLMRPTNACSSLSRAGSPPQQLVPPDPDDAALEAPVAPTVVPAVVAGSPPAPTPALVCAPPTPAPVGAAVLPPCGA